MSIVIYPYKMGSTSGKRLADALDSIRVYPDRNYVPKAHHIVVNWGNGNVPRWDGNHFIFLNHPRKVMNAINKYRSFRLFRQGGVKHPPYTTDREVALQWLDGGSWVVCRQELEGLDGSGLVLCKSVDDLPDAKLFTKYIPSAVEFRAYVFRDQLITVFDKAKVTKKTLEEKKLTFDPDIRTGGRGWVFCQNPEFVPTDLPEQAALAVKSLGLDFGGVDIVYSKEENRCYCLEVNTAPDIRETTVTKFKEVFEQYAKSIGK